MKPNAHTKTRRAETSNNPNKWFHCVHCGQPVTPETYGTQHRNHCPWCLWSRHLDETPGDRAADCGGAMEPIAVWVRPGGDWAILHRCRKCGTIHSNRIAGDDNEIVLVSLAVRPLSQPPFPLAFLTTEKDPAAENGIAFAKTPHAPRLMAPMDSEPF